MSSDILTAAIAASPGLLGAGVVWAQLKRQNRGQLHIIDRINDTDVSFQMKPNHGSSMKDQLNRMEFNLRETRNDIGGIRAENRQMRGDISNGLKEHDEIRKEIEKVRDHYHQENNHEHN